MKNIVNIDGIDYYLWISETPESYLRKLKEGHFTLDGSKLWGYISEDIYLSKQSIERIIRKPFTSRIIDFSINEGSLSTKSSFEVDLDDRGQEWDSLSELFEREEYEHTGSCDNVYYFNFLEKEKIIEETNRYIITENHFYLKYIFNVNKNEQRKSIIKTTRDYFDDLKEDVELTKEITKVWNKK